ncbi:MAG: flagellar hook-basal body complex protein FliE [Alphaproteobacteria bacterium]|nr:flagellar hook-basal body complex protein FliE [Alphaproteobacteria bacterium]
MPVNNVNPAAAAGLYAQTAKVGQGVGVAGANGGSFGQMIKQATQDAIETVRAGEKATADAVIGKADLTDVVEAMTQAELTLQTVQAVRDRMLNAYQEIMRMPI